VAPLAIETLPGSVLVAQTAVSYFQWVTRVLAMPWNPEGSNRHAAFASGETMMGGIEIGNLGRRHRIGQQGAAANVRGAIGKGKDHLRHRVLRTNVIGAEFRDPADGVDIAGARLAEAGFLDDLRVVQTVDQQMRKQRCLQTHAGGRHTRRKVDLDGLFFPVGVRGPEDSTRIDQAGYLSGAQHRHHLRRSGRSAETQLRTWIQCQHLQAHTQSQRYRRDDLDAGRLPATGHLDPLQSGQASGDSFGHRGAGQAALHRLHPASGVVLLHLQYLRGRHLPIAQPRNRTLGKYPGLPLERNVRGGGFARLAGHAGRCTRR
jgi:hypothetical protein